MSTSVTSATKFFPEAQNGFATTLASTIASGATTVPLNSVAGYTNGATAVFVVDPTSSTAKQTFTGVIDTSGVQVTSVVWTAGTNQTHTGGTTVVDYATATHISLVSKGILVAHNSDGTHKSGAVYLLPTIASFANANHDHSNSAGGGSLGAGVVTNTMLAANAAWTSYTPTWTAASANPVIGNGTLDGHYQQIGKTMFVRIAMLAGSSTTFGTGVYSFALPTAANSALTAGAYTNLPLGWCFMNGATTPTGAVVMATTTTVKVAGLQTVAGSNPVNLTSAFIASTGPLAWASTNSIVMSFFYEVA